jgi:hypothetical protein
MTSKVIYMMQGLVAVAAVAAAAAAVSWDSS